MFGTRAEWRALCDADDLRVKRHDIIVRFANDRSHSVGVHDLTDAYLVTAVVAAPEALVQVPDIRRKAWLRNRHTKLVGFRIDEDGYLVAQAWIPKNGLTADAFQAMVRAVAREADRYEFQLTGADDY
ncbi:hypothetical protein ACIBOV_07630 [Micromonospora chersina]|uniref:hypothetical protein n=1 Tax=Micromonospora chersina TaxID=47854 RepID=UPI0037A21A4D